jgi:hypothetical protein
LPKAYAAALETRDLPILSLVAVNAAALAEAHGRVAASQTVVFARGASSYTEPAPLPRGRTAVTACQIHHTVA